MNYATSSFTNATLCAPQVTLYPFINTPQADANAKVFIREYVQESANFAPLAASNTQTLPADGIWPANNSAYLVYQGEPATYLGTTCKFTRKWATVPADQVSYSTITINKPSPKSYASATGLTDATPPAEYYLYSTALFLASNVYGLVSAAWAVNYTGIRANGHGITANVDIVLSSYYYADGSYRAHVVAAANVTVVNSNYITISDSSISPSVCLYLKSVGPLIRTYTPGTDRVRVKKTTSFYLPGVTSGIASPTDIPIPDPATNDETLLGLVISYSSGYQVYDAEELQPWMGPIYQQTKIEIDMANL